MGTVRERVRARAHRRRQGLRRVQIWVPDIHSPWFAEAAHAQSVAVTQSTQAEDDQAFIDEITDEAEYDA